MQLELRSLSAWGSVASDMQAVECLLASRGYDSCELRLRVSRRVVTAKAGTACMPASIDCLQALQHAKCMMQAAMIHITSCCFLQYPRQLIAYQQAV
jgi:hypothetical protein